VPYLLCLLAPGASALAQQLEIHYINVGWGSSVFVKGPDGTKVLLEAGNDGMGSARVVPYLKAIGIAPSAGLDYTFVGHQHCDHAGGMDEVVQAGYGVRTANYYNGSSYSSSCITSWEAAASGTAAGSPRIPPLGLEIPLGNGARLTVVAVDGSILGGDAVAVSNENDRSIAVLIQYGGFDYLWASDMGGGNVDTACTGRATSSQTDVESYVVAAISPGGARPLISAGGIDVLNVNHHGSESSTNINWMNLSRPAVAVIATGAGQASNWYLPRKDVVENVLRAGASCVTVPAAFVVQTEEGDPTGTLTSFVGYSVGDIKISTNGQTTFTLSADGKVTQGPSEVSAAGLPRTFALDDVAGPGPGPSADVGGFRLDQKNSTSSYTLPAGTRIPENGYLIVARSASKAAFEAFWGVSLASNVAFLNSSGALPVINGDENYTLVNASGTTIDGQTVNMTAGGGSSFKRKDPCNNPALAASWTVTTSGSATPGSGAGAGCAKGVVINEFSDATGTGNYVYEFVELHYDK
jgi:beta-lactamase superfamily II metal-dependent hydrolase